MNTTTNYNLKKPEGTDFYNIGDFNDNSDVIDTELKKAENHRSSTSNPHGVTKSDVGLGNVPNVSTNNQTPTFTQAATLDNLVSGEKLSISFGKIVKAIAEFVSHKNNTSNPHGVTKSDVGLGNVDNTSDTNKPISIAVLTALNSKLPASGGNISGALNFTGTTSVTARIKFNRYDGAYIQNLAGGSICIIPNETSGVVNSYIFDKTNFYFGGASGSVNLGKSANKWKEIHAMAIKGLNAPTSDNDAAPKIYVDDEIKKAIGNAIGGSY